MSPAAVNLSVSRRRVVLGGLAWSVAALVGGVPVPTVGAALAQSAPSDGDEYDIPGGHFFTEGAPNGQQTGLGFAIFDGNGASLWTAFQSAGGVAQLGYPTSRRFELNGDIGQAFSTSVLVWRRTNADFEVKPLSAIGIGRVPAYALQPEEPPLAGASVNPRPWSGWWWPASVGLGPTLFGPNGPLDKYDQFVQATGGADPDTRDWERNNVYFPRTAWAGHCNGFAAAALLEPEPLGPVSPLDVTFTVGDLKGLLADYHFADSAVWSYGQDGSVNPADFQRMLLDWVQRTNAGFVVTFDLGGGETWSYPLVQFQSEWAADLVADGLWHVTTTVWLADMNVPSDFVGTKLYPGDAGMVFTYDLTGDPRHPADGEWVGKSANGRFAHPGQIWYPRAASAGIRDAGRELVSPELQRKVLDRILAE